MLPGAPLANVLYRLSVKLAKLCVRESTKVFQAANVYNFVFGKKGIHPSAWVQVEPTKTVPTVSYGMLRVLLPGYPFKVSKVVIPFIAVFMVNLLCAFNIWIGDKGTSNQPMNIEGVALVLEPEANCLISDCRIYSNGNPSPLTLIPLGKAPNSLIAFHYSAIANPVIGKSGDHFVSHMPHYIFKQTE